jgi:hypothetical protein
MSDKDHGEDAGEGSAKGKGRSKPWEKAKEATTQKINEYKYTNIDYDNDIRILKILRGRGKEPLTCMLFPSAVPSRFSASKRSNFKSFPYKSHLEPFPYKALSYMWGTDDPTYPVQMFWNHTGIPAGANIYQLATFKSKVFYVRKNLDEALRQFRHPNRDVDIWVDALCINQDDNIEKKSQVSRMGEIYSQATEVYVWLGPGNEETQKTFRLLRSILVLPELDKLIKDKAHSEQWLLIVKLMKLEWFTRRWVIQELALAKSATVRWGTESMPWEEFADAIALFMTRHDEIKTYLEKPKNFPDKQDPDAHLGLMEPRALGANTLVDATTNLFRRSDDGERIQHRLVDLEVLVSSMFLAFEASEPRDTIYAVLSLAKDTMPRPKSIGPPPWMEEADTWIIIKFFRLIFAVVSFLYNWFKSLIIVPAAENGLISQDPYSVYLDHRIAPDYAKSLTDVCADFMEYCIGQSQSLDIICRHWAPLPKKLSKFQALRLKLEGLPEERELMPTWIPSIEGHVYGDGVLAGRTNADSLVGCVERQNQQYYRASKGLRPAVTFRKNKQNIATPRDFEDKSHTNSTNGETGAAKLGTQEGKQQQPARNKFDGTLHVKGFKLDSIAHISGRVLNGVIPHEAFEYGGWPKKSKNTSYPEDVPERLWRTLVADRGPDGTNAPTWYRRACRECLNHTNTNGDLNTNQFSDWGLDDTPRTMKLFLERVRGVVWCRKFFLTHGNEVADQRPHYGLAPPGARENDIICIFFGCSVPVVLRPSWEKKGLYEFIGECYVHGMMDGGSLDHDIPPYPYKDVKGFTLI